MRMQEREIADADWTEHAETAIYQVLPALRYIDGHYDQNIRAADLARICGLSEPHFRLVFTDCINMPPMDYVNLIRVRRACSLLSRKNSPMELVAAECGFASVSAFSRNFKKFLDTTPYQWKLQEKKSGLQVDAYSISAHRGWDSANQ